jgi:ketol-acid reductoisomerase
MATKIYHDSDADLGVLKGKKIAVIGYGNQGRAQAMCLHDSGMQVTVGARKSGESWDLAQTDGLKVADIPKAVQGADVVMILLPDEVQPRVYKEQIAPHLKDGAALEFAHGFAITFKLIAPPKNCDVIMVAPKSPGRMVRQTFKEGFGVPSLIAIEQDASGKARNIALALAKGLGSTKAGVLETDFREEATSDLFGEQAVLCGGVTALIEAGFDTLIKAGYKPEIAYFEVLHELKLIVDLIQAGGMMHMWDSVSNTAEYGGLTRRDRVINIESKKAMEQILKDINSGQFAKEWTEEWTVDLRNMKKLEHDESEKQIEKVGQEIRRLFERK